MLKALLERYLKELSNTFQRGDAREESYYKHLDELVREIAVLLGIKNIEVTTLPKKTEAGNPDFRLWDGKNHIIGYIEAKDPSNTNLDIIETSEQLKRYYSTFPNVILTNFYEFRLYRHGERIKEVMIGRPILALKLQSPPPAENIAELEELFARFFSFSLPSIKTARALAIELAKRTRFLRDEVVAVELAENNGKGHKQIAGFYEAFKKYLITTLNEKQFADLYAQTITYGLFVARTRAKGEFNRKIAYDYIPPTIGILRDVFRFISLEDPPKSLQIIVDDIAELLGVTEVKKILDEYYQAGKGNDPIIHFYETFLSTYDPGIREKRGVYYTPEPVVNYIVRVIHSLLKTHFHLPDGLASPEVKLLDPAAGTLTFPVKAITLAAEEYSNKYGEGALHQWIKNHILPNYFAFELMMAPYAIGHLKIGFILDELGYKLSDDERFQLYLTNTLEMEEIKQITIPGISSLSEESHLAGKVKKEQPILVILGNPPYSGISSNINEWTEKLLKEDIDGCQSYYKVDGKPLGERNPKWLQDDYVKFLRFAQWKIQKSNYGIVGMITNHSYLDNPTFRGMRQSLMKTFEEIYILDLHGNSLKKETAPDGGKDENVFDIRQGVAIALLVKNKDKKEPVIYHADLYGLREEKYNWLNENEFKVENYNLIKPEAPYYFLVPHNTQAIEKYLDWKKINEIFPVNSVGIVTSRDNLVISEKRDELQRRILQFRNPSLPDDLLAQAYHLKDKPNWQLSVARNKIKELKDYDNYIQEILYRPFDKRYIFYHESVIERMRYEVMRNMLEENIGIVTRRQQLPDKLCNYFFISKNLIADGLIRSDNKGSETLFPLYLYPDKQKKNLFNHHQTEREANISPLIFDKLAEYYKRKLAPEEILYYIYGIFYSNIYRETYAEFLKVDFPRVPFTSNDNLFREMGELGKQLADLHLLKSPLLDPPVARYQGSGDNDRIAKVDYQQNEQCLYINKDKYFEGILPEVWNYYIGGYQVLLKYLKDRKGRIMDDAPHYCRIVTAIQKTIEIQKQIDTLYPDIEKELSPPL